MLYSCTCTIGPILFAEIGLFCGLFSAEIGLFFGNIRLCCKETGFCCGDPGLFSAEIGLFCGDIRLCCKETGCCCGDPGLFSAEIGLCCGDAGFFVNIRGTFGLALARAPRMPAERKEGSVAELQGSVAEIQGSVAEIQGSVAEI